MGACHLAPDHPVLARLLLSPLLRLLVHTVDIRYSLAQVVIRLLAFLHAIQLDQRRVGPLVPKTSLVPNEYTLIV